jgi:hypothetical protein
MKSKILRVLGVAAFVLAIGSLSACVDESYYPAYPGYAYGSPAYAYHPRYYPEYVPPPRAYAYNPRPYWRNHEGREHEEHEMHEHHHDHDRF